MRKVGMKTMKTTTMATKVHRMLESSFLVNRSGVPSIPHIAGEITKTGSLVYGHQEPSDPTPIKPPHPLPYDTWATGYFGLSDSFCPSPAPLAVLPSFLSPYPIPVTIIADSPPITSPLRHAAFRSQLVFCRSFSCCLLCVKYCIKWIHVSQTVSLLTLSINSVFLSHIFGMLWTLGH